MCVGGDSEWKGPLVHLLVGLFNFELHVVSLLIHQINLLVKFPTQFLKMRNKWRRRSRHAEQMSGWFNSSAAETISAPDSRVKTYLHLHFFDGVDSLFSLTFGLPGESSCSLGWTGWDTCPPGTSSSPQLPSAPPPPTWPHRSAAARSDSKTRSVWKLVLVCGKGIQKFKRWGLSKSSKLKLLNQNVYPELFSGIKEALISGLLVLTCSVNYNFND